MKAVGLKPSLDFVLLGLVPSTGCSPSFVLVVGPPSVGGSATWSPPCVVGRGCFRCCRVLCCFCLWHQFAVDEGGGDLSRRNPLVMFDHGHPGDGLEPGRWLAAPRGCVDGVRGMWRAWRSSKGCGWLGALPPLLGRVLWALPRWLLWFVVTVIRLVVAWVWPAWFWRCPGRWVLVCFPA